MIAYESPLREDAAVDGGTVLIVDDETSSVELVSRVMERIGFTTVTAADGEAGLAAVVRHRPDIILLDVHMPVLGGFEVCRRLKSNPTTCLIPVVLITGLAAIKDRLRRIEAGADDFLSKPFVLVELEARVRSLMRLKRYTDELDSAASLILSLGRTIEARDPYTQGHCQRLAAYAMAFGAHLGLSDDRQLALYRGGYLHDVGKVGIPDAILLKPGRLDAAEWIIMQQHPVIGDSICRELRLLHDVSPIVRHHHERADGTGYPDSLAGDEIPLLAQLMAIVDVYDALTTDRPYRAALTSDQACDELRTEVRQGWKNARFVEDFVSIVPALLAARLNGPPVGALGLVR